MRLVPKKLVKQFEHLAEKTAGHPTADRVHDLRVLTRKLRADLWLVPKSHRTKRIVRARKDLKSLARVLGAQRRLDVALEDANRYHRETKKIRIHLKKARKKVGKALRKRKLEFYSDEVARAVRDVNRLSAASLIPRVLQVKRYLLAASRHPPRTDSARHHLRIEAKKARYILATLDRDVPSLNQLQEHLGRWHDLVVLSGLSGTDKRVALAREKEWKLAEHILRSTIKRTTRSLDALAEKLAA